MWEPGADGTLESCHMVHLSHYSILLESLVERTKGHFTHKTWSPWPLHFKHSHWWKRGSCSKFHAHYAWGTNWTWMQDGCTVYMDSYMASNGSCFMVSWTTFKKPLLGGKPHTKPGDHGIPNTHDCWFILFYHVWGPAWIDIHWNIIQPRARSHMTSHYTWGSVTTLHDFWGILGRPLDILFWAPTFTWSRLLARAWSGPRLPTELQWTYHYIFFFFFVN